MFRVLSPSCLVVSLSYFFLSIFHISPSCFTFLFYFHVSLSGLVFPLRFRDDQHTGLQFALLKNLLDGDDPNVFGAVHVPNEE